MKTGGQNKKSVAKHKAEGTYNATKHGGQIVDVPLLLSVPPAPPDFDSEHRAKWEDVCRLLLEAGILAKQDADSIRSYVETSVMQRRAWQDVVRIGMIDEEKGRPNAAFLVFERCDKILKPLREQFGFTPRARQSINLSPPPEKEDPIMALLN